MADKRMFGAKLEGWEPPEKPGPDRIVGEYVVLERLDPDAHAGDLYRSLSGDASLWDYLFDGPFTSASAFHRWAREAAGKPEMVYYVLRDLGSGNCGGFAAFMRIAPEAGSIEVGSICFAPEMQRSRAATEAMYLMMRWAFEAGYRRYEWKCDALNMPSRRAAQRLGFSYEGVFRQAVVVKGRNRDTAWFAVIDKEWPALSEAYLAWLSPSNFTAAGRQRESLSDLTRLVRAASDPLL